VEKDDDRDDRDDGVDRSHRDEWGRGPCAGGSLDGSTEGSLDPGVFYDRVSPYYDDVVMGSFKKRFTDQMEADFLSSLFPEGSMLLDLGSGTGRSIALLQDRYHVFGVDISLGMVQKAVERGVGTSALGDLARLPYKSGVFNGAFCMHGALSHLPTFPDKLAVIQEIERTLTRRCVLMVDVPSPYRKDRGETYVVQWSAGGERVRLKGYAWYPEQFQEICGELGFSEIGFLGDYSLDTPFGRESRRLILVAKRAV